MLTLTVFDTSTISIGKQQEPGFTVRVTGEKITARELIRLRIFQEVEEYNQRQPAIFRMLVQPSEAERVLNGFKLSQPRQVDPQVQFEKAIEAFESNGFILLVDDKQVATLDDEISLHPEMTVNFLKLVPLVGG